MILQIVVFLVILSILVLIHEFGHFIVGKLAGIGILEFALGLPFTKPIFQKKLKSGMKISLYPILFGGFVNLLGEETEHKEEDKEAKTTEKIKGVYFYQKPVLTRMAVVVAGVTMNFFLAVFVFYIFLGLSSFKIAVLKITDYKFISPKQDRVILTYVQKDSPAEKSGLVGGEIVESVDGMSFVSSDEFKNYVKKQADKPIQISVSNTELTSSKTVSVTPRSKPPEGQGALGVGIGEASVIAYNSLPEKVSSGLFYGVDMFMYNLSVIKHFIEVSVATKDTTLISEGVSGPIGIYSVVGDIINLGGKTAIIGLLNFLGLMSMSLAFMNVLPFPALDGGKLFLLTIEGLTRKKLSPKLEARISQIGMAFLLILIALISYSDIIKIFKR